jgi:chromosome segregation ATPase
MLSAALACRREKRALVASRDNLDRLYRDASTSLTILERSHRFTMSDLDHHRDELRASQDEVSRLGKLLSTNDSAIKELCASKKLVMQELEVARLTIKALEDDRIVMKAMCDKAMDKVVRAGQILMRRPGVVVPEDIVADVVATPDAASSPSSYVAPANDASCKNTPAQ